MTSAAFSADVKRSRQRVHHRRFFCCPYTADGKFENQLFARQPPRRQLRFNVGLLQSVDRGTKVSTKRVPSVDHALVVSARKSRTRVVNEALKEILHLTQELPEKSTSFFV